MRGMKIPLISLSFIDTQTNKQKLEIWSNGERHIVDPPFQPYIISMVELPIVEGEFTVHPTVGYPLSTLCETQMYKYSFPHTGAIAKLNRELELAQNKPVKSKVCDNHTEFRERIIIDQPEYFRKFANTNDLTLFCFDIETLTFNNRDFTSIISISWGSDINHIVSVQAPVYWLERSEAGARNLGTIDELLLRLEKNPDNKTPEEEMLYNSDREQWQEQKIHEFTLGNTPFVTEEDEIRLIKEFLSALRHADPDIVTGFNHKDFDFMRIFDRCRVYGIDYQIIARGNGKVSIGQKKQDFIEYNDVSMTGRVVYDLFFSVKADQSLHGIKRRGLKDVAEWMNIPTIRENTHSTALIPINNLKLYNESDVFVTFKLFSVYFLNNQTLAEMFGVPLNMILDGSPSFLANVFQAPELHKLGIVSDGMNRERHREIYDAKYKEELKAAEHEDDDEDGEEYYEEPEEGDDKKKKGVYEAAYVDIYQTGFFEFVDKVDYKGMYNAIEITANLSPETTKIIKYLPYNKNGFKYEKRGSNIIYYVPDKRIGKIVVIAVNNQRDGVLRIKLKDIRNERAIIKQRMKTCHPDELPALESQQYGLKVVANIPSGYNGQSSSRWGDIAVSILTVGIGRLLIRDTIKYVEAKYGGNDWIMEEEDLRLVPKEKFNVCIEVDTDGIYISKHIDVKALNAYLEKRVKELLGVEESEMTLDMDEYKEGFFFKMKTYILYDKKDNLVIHGGGFKGSKQPKCFDKALEKLVRCRLKHEGEPTEVIRDILNLDQYPFGDLSLGVKLSKAPETYEPGTIWGKLIRKAAALGQEVKAGTGLDYIKTLGGYDLAYTVQSRQEIDKKYYTNTLSKLIINLGYKDELKAKDTGEVDDWLEAPATTQYTPVDDGWGDPVVTKPIEAKFTTVVDEKIGVVVTETKDMRVVSVPVAKIDDVDLDDWL